jgi:autotransporter translocation and assembly factor TamB
MDPITKKEKAKAQAAALSERTLKSLKYKGDDEKEPKVDAELEGSGDNENYRVRGSINVPVYKGLSVGATKMMGKEEGESYGGSTFNVGFRKTFGSKKNKK